MASLYAAGWRQGSVFEADLPLGVIVVTGGVPVRSDGTHGRWAVASQDCDLDGTEADSPEPTIEIRPIYAEMAPTDWGIRSSKFLLRDGEYLVSSSPREHVAAAVLTALLAAGNAARREPDPDRKLGLATWLGLRYDRPAVPEALVPLARRVATEVRRNRITGRKVRDVLMLFDESVSPPRYSLYAVTLREEDRDEVREWLAAAAQAVPVDLGVADVIEAAPATEISFDLVEKSYAADVSQLTWRGSQPAPDGAT
jgi:hypothetical protein